MQYPSADPVIFSGALALRWYGLMYLLGFAAVYLLGQWRITNRPQNLLTRWEMT